MLKDDSLTPCSSDQNLFSIFSSDLFSITAEQWEICYGDVLRGQLVMTALSRRIYAHKQEIEYEGKSRLQ